MKRQKDKSNLNYLFNFILIICFICILYLLIINLYYQMIKLNNKEHQILVERLNTEQADETTRKLKYIKEVEGYNIIAILEIPSINLKSYVIEEYSEQSLRFSITKFFGSNPNDIGNFCISGHNYRINNNKMFSNLKKLEIGEEIFLTDGYGKKVKYEVYDVLKVLPTETSCLLQFTKSKREITLITCTPDSKQRIIVKAIEIEEI